MRAHPRRIRGTDEDMCRRRVQWLRVHRRRHGRPPNRRSAAAIAARAASRRIRSRLRRRPSTRTTCPPRMRHSRTRSPRNPAIAKRRCCARIWHRVNSRAMPHCARRAPALRKSVGNAYGTTQATRCRSIRAASRPKRSSSSRSSIRVPHRRRPVRGPVRTFRNNSNAWKACDGSREFSGCVRPARPRRSSKGTSIPPRRARADRVRA